MADRVSTALTTVVVHPLVVLVASVVVAVASAEAVVALAEEEGEK